MPHRLPVSKTTNLGNLRATILYYTVNMTAARNSLGKSSGLYISPRGPQNAELPADGAWRSRAGHRIDSPRRRVGGDGGCEYLNNCSVKTFPYPSFSGPIYPKGPVVGMRLHCWGPKQSWVPTSILQQSGKGSMKLTL